MLFPYIYVPNHQMETMQSIVDYLFNEVWCKALDEKYGIHLFQGHLILKSIMEELVRRESAEQLKKTGTDTKFYLSVNEIFSAFSSLDREDLEVYKKYFDDNNSVDELCTNTAGFEPVHYNGLDSKYADLNTELNTFFSSLYSSGFFGLAFVKKLIGSDLTGYYKDFVRHNTQGMCPFCGLYPLDNEFDPTREAFDHYLPKAKYPFNSVNLKNLAPSCNKCNSGNKGEKDPLHDEQGNRRKAFYPFSVTQPDLNLNIEVLKKDWKNLQPEDLSIAYNTQAHQDEIETWKALFKVDKRYKALCCGSDNSAVNGGKYWLTQLFDEWQQDGRSPASFMKTLNRHTENFPFSERNFLRKAFLEGCQNAGLFE